MYSTHFSEGNIFGIEPVPEVKGYSLLAFRKDEFLQVTNTTICSGFDGENLVVAFYETEELQRRGGRHERGTSCDWNVVISINFESEMHRQCIGAEEFLSLPNFNRAGHSRGVTLL
jgi:hypothetical protein